MEIRALVPVAPGDELAVSYMDLFQPTAARRKELEATKHFLCGCVRCTASVADGAMLEGVCCGVPLCRARPRRLPPRAPRPAPTAPGGGDDDDAAMPGAKADAKQKKKKKKKKDNDDKKADAAQLAPPPPPSAPAPAPAKVPV